MCYLARRKSLSVSSQRLNDLRVLKKAKLGHDEDESGYKAPRKNTALHHFQPQVVRLRVQLGCGSSPSFQEREAFLMPGSAYRGVQRRRGPNDNISPFRTLELQYRRQGSSPAPGPPDQRCMRPDAA